MLAIVLETHRVKEMGISVLAYSGLSFELAYSWAPGKGTKVLPFKA